jgi:SAM-dependent methyltransferase
MPLDVYHCEPLSIENDIPVFSNPDEYTENYERIASDHLASLRRDGTNPFIAEELWRQSEASTIALIRRYVRSGGTILDVGVGLGHLLAEFPELRRFGMDISWGYLEIAKAAGIEVCFARIEDMPYREGAFDVVVCTDVLEHVFDLNLCCAKLLAAVKPGGLVIVRVPYREDLSGYLATTCPYRYVHLRAFDEHGLRLLFERVFGCSVLETHLAGYMPYENRLRVPVPLPGGRAVLSRVLSIVRTLREAWHARLVRVLYLPIEINAVVRTPGRPNLHPARGAPEVGDVRLGP